MKRLSLIILLFAMPLSIFAQILSNEDDIIDRQLSKNYFYGEGTETLDSTAKAKALEKLISNAQRNGVIINPKDAEYYYYFSEASGLRYIHVCAFIKKPANQSAVTIAQQTSTDESEVVIHPTNSQKDSSHPSTPTKTNNHPKEPVASPLTHNTDQPTVVQTRWKQDAIDHLVKSNDLSTVVERLERMMLTMKIDKYGRYQDCDDKTSAFWAIFDSKNQLVAILGEGSSSRYNYKTKKTDCLEKYITASYKILWFSFND